MRRGPLFKSLSSPYPVITEPRKGAGSVLSIFESQQPAGNTKPKCFPLERAGSWDLRSPSPFANYCRPRKGQMRQLGAGGV